MAISRPNQIDITKHLAQHLIVSQFPQWSHLSIQPVKNSGWDNRTFHLGDELLIRMPSGEEYAGQAEKEQTWLPKLASQLPLPIPSPIAMGKPDELYPWAWSINRWLLGEAATQETIYNFSDFAKTLAQFLKSLQSIDSTDGPVAGPHSFYRGGSLAVYNAETRQAIALLKDIIDASTALQLWEEALVTSWRKSSVWVHGDISLGNLLVEQGQLSAVIDFGQLAIGDPACDLAIAWTLFEEESRDAFMQELHLDSDTWLRGQAWALWKALMYLVNKKTNMNFEARRALRTINEVIADFRRVL